MWRDPNAVVKRLVADRNGAVIAASGVTTFVVLWLTGGAVSPLAPMAALWLFIAAWQLGGAASAIAVGATATLLALLASADGLAASELLHVVTLVSAGVVPAALLRRYTRRSTPGLKPEPATSSPETPAPDATRRQEVTQALADLCQHCGARRAVLWSVDGDAISARQYAASDAALGVTAAAIRGDPLGWVWEHGISLRLTPTPNWADPDSVVTALRVERGNGASGLVTFEFHGGSAVPSLASLESSLASLRRLLVLHDEHAVAAADRGRLEMLVGALRRLPARIDLAGFANGLLDDALRLSGATGGAIGIWVRNEGRIVAVCDADGGPPLGGTFEPLESEMALAARGGALIVREGRSAVGSRVAIATPADRWDRQPRALAVLPLPRPDDVVGVLALWSSEAPRIDPGAVELLRTLAPFAGFQLAHALEFDRVKEDAERDGLTGLLNRRMFDQALESERARHERYGHPMALLLIDVDHFKAINDRHGHEAGDLVLRTISRVILAGVRDVDVPARFGGEEFAVLLPETSPEAAADVAERLRASVERCEVPWSGETLSVRVSVGVSSCPACVRDPRALVRSADAALYQAKTLGRNRVIRAPATG